MAAIVNKVYWQGREIEKSPGNECRKSGRRGMALSVVSVSDNLHILGSFLYLSDLFVDD